MLHDGKGFALALKETAEPSRCPPSSTSALEAPRALVRVRALADRLRRNGIPIVEEWQEADYVSVKCRDPDGYVVELAWEPSSDAAPNLS